jgi:hypothetical protein
MSQFYRLAMPIIALALTPACDSDRAHSIKMFEKAKMFENVSSATVSFDDKKEVRLLGIHAERAMLGSQPTMIATFAEQLPLTANDREIVTAKVATFTARLADADARITALESASAEQWVVRDAATTDAMRRVEAARDDAWSAIKNARRIDAAS